MMMTGIPTMTLLPGMMMSVIPSLKGDSILRGRTRRHSTGAPMISMGIHCQDRMMYVLGDVGTIENYGCPPDAPILEDPVLTAANCTVGEYYNFVQYGHYATDPTTWQRIDRGLIYCFPR